MTERQKIEQWDFIDNAIFKLMEKVNPSKRKLKWDIKPISEIREVILKYFVEDLTLCTEADFYP